MHIAKNATFNNETTLYYQNQNVYIWKCCNVKVAEFDHFKIEAGLPTFFVKSKTISKKTGAVGILTGPKLLLLNYW